MAVRAMARGTSSSQSRRKRPVNSKLDMNKARAIRNAASKGRTTVAELARKYDVHHSTIQSVIRNKTWI